MEDVESFIAWLGTQGTPAAHLPVYRHYAGELAKHPSLSAALRAAEEAGAPEQQIKNLRMTAAKLAGFENRRFAPAQPEATPIELAVDPKPPPRDMGKLLEVSRPRQGCTCTRHRDVYLDNDFGALARWLGGGVGLGTIVLIRFIGALGTAALALGLAGMGGLVTITSICLRCEGCRSRVRDLDDEEKAHVRAGRKRVVLVTAGLLAGAALCGALWISAAHSAMNRHTP